MNEYFYEIDLAYNNGKTGTLSSAGLPVIEVVTQPQFVNDHRNCWTPEHLLAGAISFYLMNAFYALAEKDSLDIISYKSNSLIRLEKKSGFLEATEILIRPIIQFYNDQSLAKAMEIMDQAEKACPIKNLLKLNVEIHAKFNFSNRGEQVVL